MLSPIPASILRETLTLYVPSGFDRYQKPITAAYTVENVHMQTDNKTSFLQLQGNGQNTEVTLKGVIFVDARLSTPLIDFEALQEQAQAAGGVCTLTVTSPAGRVSGPYTLQIVDALPDDEDNLHHYELGVT